MMGAPLRSRSPELVIHAPQASPVSQFWTMSAGPVHVHFEDSTKTHPERVSEQEVWNRAASLIFDIPMKFIRLFAMCSAEPGRNRLASDIDSD
jgi:hypothetical protein